MVDRRVYKFIQMAPFSDKIVFLDTEFTTLDPYEGEIISIGLVTPEGKELYLELEYKGECSDWVKKNILQKLNGQKISREEARRKIKEFIGNSKPFMISYVNSFDVIYFYKLMKGEEEAFFWLPIDFASILFGHGIDPESYSNNNMEMARNLGVDVKKYVQHNALDDAKLLRDVYFKFIKTT